MKKLYSWLFLLLETILHTDDSIIRKEINLSIEATLDLYENELNSNLWN